MKLWLCCGVFLELQNPFGKKKPSYAANHQLFQPADSQIDPRTGKLKVQKNQTPNS
jgi:hypothetical protein